MNKRALMLKYWRKEKIKALIAQYANKFFAFLRTAYIEVFLISVVCYALGYVFNSADSIQERMSLAYFYLISSYLLFTVLTYVKFKFLKTREKPQNLLLRLINNYYIYVSMVIAFCLILILESSSQNRLLYNYSTLLGYGLFLFHFIAFTHIKLNLKIHNLNSESLKKYFIYALVLALLFFFSTTMDQSDPYGPNFQLRIVFWLLLVHLVLSWFLSQLKLVKQLENERTNAELLHLKSQINPHFLFNTLNNLYGLALEKSEQAPQLILKLSDMLRYTIYQGKIDEVALVDEINYLENYIDLQRIRNQQRVKVDFQQCIDCRTYKIAPLLLIILLENAYKHGVEQITEDAFINIQLKVEKSQFSFKITNSFEVSMVNKNKGIGLENLAKRLELIYPRQYNLNTEINDLNYSVELQIQLDEVV